MIERIPVTIILLIVGLICLVIGNRPALNKREQKKLQELDSIIARTYGGK